MKKYGAETKAGYRAIFSKNLKQTITHPLPLFAALLIYF